MVAPVIKTGSQKWPGGVERTCTKEMRPKSGGGKPRVDRLKI